jgi:hypothetical protein
MTTVLAGPAVVGCAAAVPPGLLLVQTLHGADVLAVGVMMPAVGGVTVGTVLSGALAAGAISF